MGLIVTEGTWTPTGTTGTNVTAAIAVDSSAFIQIGDTVNIAARLNITTDSGGAGSLCQFSFLLPVVRTETFSTTEQLQFTSTGFESLTAVEAAVPTGFLGGVSTPTCFMSFFNGLGGVQTYGFVITGNYRLNNDT